MREKEAKDGRQRRNEKGTEKANVPSKSETQSDVSVLEFH